MLLEFSTANFRSFRDRVTLSFVASSDDWLEDDNVAISGAFRVVKAAAIYGPNAGGKSNLLFALQTMRNFVLNSSKDSQKDEKIPVTPFRLDTQTENAPSLFEVVFALKGARYRYGFEADAQLVRNEWLFVQRDSTRDTTLFTREGDQIKPGPDFREGKGLEERTRPNALFLSVVAQFNGAIAGELLTWFNQFRYITGIRDGNYLMVTSNMLRDVRFSGQVLDLVRQADFGIEQILSRDVPADKLRASLSPDLPEAVREQFLKRPPFEMKTLHRKFSGEQSLEELVEFDLARDESAGTAKFVGFMGPFLHTLSTGSILVVDELEARLHPHLTKALVRLFNSSANRQNAQIIFATHDVGLLDASSIRRDQLWFVEKTDRGASTLYPLTDFSVRKEGKFQREYLLGQFGAVPRVGDFRETLLHGER